MKRVKEAGHGYKFDIDEVNICQGRNDAISDLLS